MSVSSFFWYDYETFGLNPSQDRVVQFAGLRTNLDLEPIADPLMFYCRLSPDYLPSPEACLVTGISPQIALAKGLAEPEFIAKINTEMAIPGTCSVGYNSIAFDDEFTRNLLYRNFFDPYAREYGENRGRWDILNMVRMTAALRPDGINWPKNEKGFNSFKLTALSAANHIEHEQAHDALGDVYATLALAKLIKQQQPQLFDYLLHKIRNKNQVKDLLYKAQMQQESCVYTNTILSAKQGYTSLVLPLGAHPVDNNRVLAIDLMQDPSTVLNSNIEALQQAIFDKKGKRPKGLCSIKINACPALAPKGVLNSQAAARLGINLEQCEQHQAQILADGGLYTKLSQVYDRPYAKDADLDAEAAIYQGFLSYADKRLCDQVRQSSATELATKQFKFTDSRLSVLLWRYKARHFPESLSPKEQQRWQQFRQQRLGLDDGYFAKYLEKLEGLIASAESEQAVQILNNLLIYVKSLAS